jgi:sortase A
MAQDIMQKTWERVADGVDGFWPWPWNHTWPIARLSARSGEVDLVILAGGNDRTLTFGPGHLSVSSQPGKRGNSVILGHRDTHFNFLKDLAIGESLTVESMDGNLHVYTVVDLDVVHARRTSLEIDTDGAYLSLVTRYPFSGPESKDDSGMRYVVTAKKLL